MLLAIALTVRVVLWVSRATYGLHGVPGLPLSAWGDFDSAYVPWLSYLERGLLPYRDFYTYKYTPLFIYSLYPFFIWAGSHAAAIPLVVSDAATALLVYVVSKKFAGNRAGFAAGIIYALFPLVLYDQDYLWLSGQPMTLFIMLSMYFVEEEMPLASFASLGVAVMFRQEALLLLPGYLAGYAWNHGKPLLRGLGLFLGVILIVSLPFLLIAPADYIYSLNYLPINQYLGLGAGEPSALIASHIVNAIPSEPNPLGTCQVTTLAGLYTGKLCGTVVNQQAFVSSLLVGRLEQVASFLAPMLMVLLAPVLFVSRHSPNIRECLGAFSLLALLWLFSALVEPALAYYFIPVYALLVASTTDVRTAAVGGFVAILTLVVPEGPFQFILPIGYMFGILVLQDIARSSAARRAPRLGARRNSGNGTDNSSIPNA